MLCRSIEAHPRLNQHGNPLVTIIDPLPLPGSHFALNFSVQIVDVKIDFHPGNVVTLPAELAPLPAQRLAISLKVCAGIGCPPAQAIADNIPPPPDPDADPNAPPPPPPPQVVLPPGQRLICVCLDASLVGGFRFKEYFQHFFLEPVVDRIEISDIQPPDLESGLECLIDATLRFELPAEAPHPARQVCARPHRRRLDFVQPKPVPVSPQVPNNPALEQNEVRAFIDVEVS